MHRRNAAANNCAAESRSPAPKIEQGRGQARAGDQYGNEQG